MVTLRIQKGCARNANGTQVLQGLSLTNGLGMFALLGPNRAGQSRLMRAVATRQLPYSGTIHVRDIDVLADPHLRLGGAAAPRR